MTSELNENGISSEMVMIGKIVHVTVSGQHAEARQNKTNAP